MDGLYEWIRNITYYLIFITVVTNLLPDRKYEKYFKLFAGMVLILLVLKPLTGGLRLDDKLAYYFESISFQKQAGELSKEISDMEGRRLDSIISQYEEAVETDLKTMAEADGLSCGSVKAVIEKDQNSSRFGQVVSVDLKLSSDEGGENGPKANENAKTVEPVAAVEQITPVVVDTGQASESAENEEISSQESEDTPGEEPVSSGRGVKEAENGKLSGLRRRIAEYYDLEEQDIEIQLETGKR